MKTLLLLLLISVASAEEIQLDLSGNTASGVVTGSLVIDSLSGTLMPNFIDANGALYEMTGSGIQYSSYSASLNGQSLVSASSGTATLFMLAESSVSNPTGTYEFFLQGPGNLFFHTSFPVYTSMEYAALADPLATLLLNASVSPDANLVGGTDGGGIAGFEMMSYKAVVRAVPEPSILVLFVLGFSLLAIRRIRTR
jgi:hypothetical protein